MAKMLTTKTEPPAKAAIPSDFTGILVGIAGQGGMNARPMVLRVRQGQVVGIEVRQAAVLPGVMMALYKQLYADFTDRGTKHDKNRREAK